MEEVSPFSPWLGLGLMAAAFALLAAAEIVWPFRAPTQPRSRRWRTNLVLFAASTLAARAIIPLTMVGTAMLAAQENWGLFNLILVPGWVAIITAVLALDLALYVQHWATHRFALLWRLHMVHHVDRDFDVSTAARFHPVEIVISMAYKIAIVAALGAPTLAVFIFEVGFAVFTVFTHTNIALPAALDRALRFAIVTPNMHRIHHSARPEETNSNYGTFLTVWDRIFGTYTPQAYSPQRSMTIGLNDWQDEQPARLGFSLLLPMRK